MGFLDSLKKFVDAASDIVGDVTDEANELLSKAEDKVKETVSENTAAQAAPAAKPSVQRETTFFGGETGDDEYRITFMLSGDFVEFDSHCEWDPSYQYEPTCTEDYTEFRSGLPCIFFGPVDEAYAVAETYLAGGRPDAKEFIESDEDAFLFRIKLPMGNSEMLCAYVFAKGTPMEQQVLGLSYPNGMVGTPLERKLIAALDEAAQTYTQTLV